MNSKNGDDSRRFFYFELVSISFFSKRLLLFEFGTIKTEVDYNGRCETPVGDAGRLKTIAGAKVGMLKPRRPVVTHA